MRVLPPFERARVLVVGDVMLDRYWHGDTTRVSPEAPVPVVRVREREDRPGGAANVAVNVAAVGARAALVGVVGHDEAGASVESLLVARGVEPRLVRHPSAGTITKWRVLSRHQQLIRLDSEPEPAQLADAGLGAGFAAALDECDVVVVSDYAKGTLSDVQALIQAARAAGKPVLVDPKGLDFGRYRGATLITPNLNEFEAVVGVCGDDAILVERAAALARAHALDAVLVTRGDRGMTLVERDGAVVHLGQEARQVYDVTGAGDTVIAVLAAAIAAGDSPVNAARLANAAAGIVVGKLGAATVSRDELAASLALVHHGGVLDEERLVLAVAAARAAGETVVMTNGCFDILHAGHVGYLEAARALGDRLVVAVNDDDSVRRLKGPRRPVNPIDQRMEVLAALGCVDWVVPFAEDTPERLICRVLPAVLVKGGDYRPEDVAGGGCVRRNGGRVTILPYRAGCSTSATIAALAGGSEAGG
ncbi:MAG: bifunctional D-glycero-beta-D-manno-heptose-7-phosphate kinase/D-glycero-beta-D-manno-heptose 1-phosphate adenylyltransferase HldE [Ectothiorhodospiraceae bacterium]|nr:bifunctional D-glycero-beta-D-manno-heptose-7-phosphate kinase/D-glycero-beta-D-manno-heptose 1-phosphate adenylyltransferase HldE [Ectothiorhodospiraceae bacterium]